MNSSEKWVAFSTIARKEVIRILRIWGQTLLPSVITHTLYLAIFGTFIGSRLGEMQGFTYIQFILPGIIMMAIIINSYTNVSSSFFSAKFQKNIEELMVSPTPNFIIVLGYAAGGILRSFLIGAMLLIVSLFFTDISVHHVWIVLAMAFLTSMVFSLAGFLNAIFSTKFDDLFIVPTFILTPLTYLGGVFYSISLLPPVWQKISLINPIHYIIDGFRYGFLGVSDSNIWISMGMLAVFTVVLIGINLHLLKKGTGMRN
jgi:ABC-2 type transport system permease protein